MLASRIFLGIAWISASLLVLGFVRGIGIVRWRLTAAATTGVLLAGVVTLDRAFPLPRTPMGELQVKELREVDEFIARKDEWGLREMFDFPDIFEYNAKLVRKQIYPSTISSSESAQIDAFFQGGNAVVDIKHVDMRIQGHSIFATIHPGKIALINTSAKYERSRSLLLHYIASPELPQSVVDALKEFNVVIQVNTNLITDSLNDSWALDRDSVLSNDDSASKWFGSASGAYWRRFTNLKPAAEKVNHAIRDALGAQ